MRSAHPNKQPIVSRAHFNACAEARRRVQYVPSISRHRNHPSNIDIHPVYYFNIIMNSAKFHFVDKRNCKRSNQICYFFYAGRFYVSAVNKMKFHKQTFK